MVICETVTLHLNAQVVVYDGKHVSGPFKELVLKCSIQHQKGFHYCYYSHVLDSFFGRGLVSYAESSYTVS